MLQDVTALICTLHMAVYLIFRGCNTFHNKIKIAACPYKMEEDQIHGRRKLFANPFEEIHFDKVNPILHLRMNKSNFVYLYVSGVEIKPQFI